MGVLGLRAALASGCLGIELPGLRAARASGCLGFGLPWLSGLWAKIVILCLRESAKNIFCHLAHQQLVKRVSYGSFDTLFILSNLSNFNLLAICRALKSVEPET